MEQIDELNVEIEADVNFTEDIVKVKKAVCNLFGELKFETIKNEKGILLKSINADFESLSQFRNLLRREKILNAARKPLSKDVKDDLIVFFLNKQVAFVRHISFCQPENESILGPIKVKIKYGNPKKITSWLTQK